MRTWHETEVRTLSVKAKCRLREFDWMIVPRRPRAVPMGMAMGMAHGRDGSVGDVLDVTGHKSASLAL